MLTPDSRFDKYLKGYQSALNADEAAGLKLFVEKGCAVCHNGINLGEGAISHSVWSKNRVRIFCLQRIKAVL